MTSSASYPHHTMEDQRDHEELERTAPTLHQLRGRTPFVVPEKFFDQFPYVVQARVHAERKKTWYDWLRTPTVAWRLALVPVLLLMVSMAVWLWSPVSGPAPGFTSTSDQELLQESWDTHTYMDLLMEGGATADLLAEAGQGWTIDEMDAYLEHTELPLELLLELP